jgi:hypothetical protein
VGSVAFSTRNIGLLTTTSSFVGTGKGSQGTHAANAGGRGAVDDEKRVQHLVYLRRPWGVNGSHESTEKIEVV